MKLVELTSYLDELLKIKDWQEKDNGANGLQIVGKEEVQKVAFAVDACEYTIKKAINEKADLLIVHHSLIHGKINRFNEITCKRMKHALCAGLSIYGAHLSLDSAEEIGHNDQMLKALGGTKKGRFDDKIGAYGSIKIKRKDLIEKLKTITGNTPIVLPFGPEEINCIAVITGNGAKAISLLPSEVDTMITGTYDDGIIEMAKEMKVNVLFGGHIATEELGLIALSKILESKGLKTVFIKQLYSSF